MIHSQYRRVRMALDRLWLVYKGISRATPESRWLRNQVLLTIKRVSEAHGRTFIG